MDELRMANLERLVTEIDHFLSGTKEAGALPATENRDASWELRVSDDRLFAWLETYPPVGAGIPLDAAEIIEALEEAGLCLLDPGKIRMIVEECNKGAEVRGADALIASGTAPVDPVEGKIEFLVSFEKVKLVDETDERAIDWKNLWSIPIVHTGDIIARVHSPQEGVEGVDIYGRPLAPRRAAPFRVKFGEGVIASEEDGTTEVLTARDVGQPVFRGGELDVLPVLEVPGDVDILSGDIDFIGSVVVHGSVTEGFSVKAGRDVSVSGSAFNARIEASGSCIVEGGIVGERCEIRAGEDIRAGFVEYGLLISGVNIEILGYTLFATLEARQSVLVQGKNRRGIIGGVTIGGTTIKTLSAGSAMEPRTLLEAGRDAVRNRNMAELTAKMAELEEMSKKIEQAMLSIKRPALGFDLERLSEEEKGKLFLLARYHKKVGQNVAELAGKIEDEKRAILAERKGTPLIKIRDKIHANVTLKIWESQLTVSSAEFCVGYYFDRKNGSIQKGLY